MIDPPPGPTVDDFASAWAGLPAFDATAPTDITVDGFVGKQIEFTVPDYDEEDCPYGDFMLMGDDSGDGYWAQAPNTHHRLLILDVDGQRLVITAFWYPDTSAADRAAIDDLGDRPSHGPGPQERAYLTFARQLRNRAAVETRLDAMAATRGDDSRHGWLGRSARRTHAIITTENAPLRAALPAKSVGFESAVSSS
jgi:hypothetical protein